MSENLQQMRKSTPEEDIRELFSRTAKLNDAVSALLAPGWGSEAGIIPADHPLYVGEKPPATASGYCPACGRGDVAPTADEYEQQRHRAELLAATLGEVLREFVQKGHPGVPCLRTPWINVKTVARWRSALQADQQPNHDDGPSVREAAADDWRWPLEKAGE